MIVAHHLQQSRLWPEGTVCITIAANIAHSAILTYPACFPDSVVGVIPDPELCLKEYLEFFIRTARRDLEQYAPATAQKNINIAILSDVAVPLPPHQEQKEIVKRVTALLTEADQIEAKVLKAVSMAEKLTQSILAKAFRGELFPTEAELARREGRDYEPASVLLERIKKQREEELTSTKAKRKQKVEPAITKA
jgi:type I restriction enzyme, S subunit